MERVNIRMKSLVQCCLSEMPSLARHHLIITRIGGFMFVQFSGCNHFQYLSDRFHLREKFERRTITPFLDLLSNHLS